MKTRKYRFLGFALGAVTVALASYVWLLRPWHLRWGATDAELARTWPGDELLPGVTGHVTRAITIDATPEEIWPWLMQIGQDRGGFYSYSRLENLFRCEMPNVERLVPQWPDRVLGEKVWFATPRNYDGKAYMIAAIVEPHRALVLSAGPDLAARQAATWGFFLEPAGANRTRLIVRLRAAETSGIVSHAVGYSFWEPAHFVMERKMLTKIRQLAERGSGGTA
jgi:hypothetical protein